MRTALLSFLFFAASTPQLVAQDTSTVAGTVYDAESGEALVGVQVVALRPGSEDRIEVSDAEGNFAFADLMPGVTEVRARVNGYVSLVEVLDLQVGQGVFLDIGLPRLNSDVLYLLGEIESSSPRVSTAVSKASRVWDGGVAGSRGGGTVGEFLQRVPGLEVRRSGQGSSLGIRVRGSTSISASNAPLIFVNGTRIQGPTDEAARVFDELPLSQVRSIDILKGPDAMGFGMGSTGGVVLIWTY